MSVLSKKEILKYIYHSEIDERLVITPILSESQISSGSVDIRLNTEFIVLKQSRVTGLILDALEMYSASERITVQSSMEKNRQKIESDLIDLSDTIHIPLGEKFILHPGQFVLTSTLEFIRLPKTIMAYVIGRSSWGRLGLNIATATMVSPGFSGSITFEMVNMGTVPIALYPGSCIAQLVFHELTKDYEQTDSKEEIVSPKKEGYLDKSDAKYQSPIGPESSKIHKDRDWDMLIQFQNGRLNEEFDG
jgi:dCTP deaminase